MTLKRIRLELARDPDFPDGSRERGYDLIAPIDENDRLVAEEWRHHRDRLSGSALLGRRGRARALSS